MNPTKLNLPLTLLSNGGPIILKGVRPAYQYTDGKRGDNVIGLRVEVVFEKNGYETLTVTVADPVDRLSAVLKNADGPVYADFEGFTARFYVMNGRPGISAKADSVRVVTPDDFDLDIDIG